LSLMPWILAVNRFPSCLMANFARSPCTRSTIWMASWSIHAVSCCQKMSL